jgi:hypothetical protein
MFEIVAASMIAILYISLINLMHVSALIEFADPYDLCSLCREL